MIEKSFAFFYIREVNVYGLETGGRHRIEIRDEDGRELYITVGKKTDVQFSDNWTSLLFAAAHSNFHKRSLSGLIFWPSIGTKVLNGVTVKPSYPGGYTVREMV